MGKDSKIEWTDHTFNPWIGCTRVSAGCKNCYAESLMDTRLGRVEWGPLGRRKKTSDSYWEKPLRWNLDAAKLGIRQKVFCASLADIFEHKPDQPELDLWRASLWDLILATPNLDWLLLTKRPENINMMLPPSWRPGLPHNVWIGISAENQKTYMERFIHLLKISAPVRFLSLEPLLGPITLGLAGTMPKWISEQYRPMGSVVDWVIVGGESGDMARPMQASWVQNIRDECLAYDVPFMFKQWGRWVPADQIVMNDDWARKQPKDGMLSVGKKRAGKSLDGVEWLEFPEPI